MKRSLLLLPLFTLGCAQPQASAHHKMPGSHKECEMQPGEMHKGKMHKEGMPSTDTSPTAEAAMSGRLDILTSSGLTQEQKTQFMDVMNQTHLKVTEIKKQEGEIKATLFRSLAEGVYDKKLVNNSKAKLKKLEEEKMNLMFNSLDKVRGILGTEIKLDPEIFREYHDRALF